MSLEFEKNLEKYADVILKIGLNLQSGQKLLIGPPFVRYGTPIELHPLIRLIVKKAYQLGAKFVDVLWDDEQLTLTRFQNAPNDTLEEFPKWRYDIAIEVAKSGGAILIIAAMNPDLLEKQPFELVTTYNRTFGKHYKPFLDLRHKDVMNCTIITAPVEGWVDKVFPNLPPEKRKEKFWDVLFEICRIKEEDPVATWESHIKELATRSKYLNQKHYKALKFVAPGTNLTVYLPKNHIWHSARATTQNGIKYVANIPTEEVFTLPLKDKTEGVVSATRPNSLYNFSDFTLTFSKGEVINAKAKRGEENLLALLKRDEGAKRLGEVALVPHSSPISQIGLIFYNTLFDENASCHLALGQGIRSCVKNGDRMPDDEFLALGGNISQIHSDFMIGSGEMDVDGILNDGTIDPIMRKGEWAFGIQPNKLNKKEKN